VKTFKMVVSLMILGIFLITAPAMAAQVTLVTSQYSYSPGGEFTWKVSNDLSWILNNYSTDTKSATAQTFQSFCIETNEYINWGSIYNVAFSNGAIAGGSGGTIVNGTDLISKGTAWLYSQFAAGTLAGYNWADPQRSDSASSSAALLQNAIWYLEGEAALQANNIFYAAAETFFGSATAAKADAADGEYGVKVMNLTDANGGQHQDQLVMANVPEPSTLILLGICLVGAAIAVKKFHFEV
jgi:hypothetical protein